LEHSGGQKIVVVRGAKQYKKKQKDAEKRERNG